MCVVTGVVIDRPMWAVSVTVDGACAETDGVTVDATCAETDGVTVDGTCAETDGVTVDTTCAETDGVTVDVVRVETDGVTESTGPLLLIGGGRGFVTLVGLMDVVDSEGRSGSV